MLKRFAVFALAALLLATSPAHALDKDKTPEYAVGHVREVTGEAKITRAGKTEVKDLHRGDDIFENDVITTDKKSSVRIYFKDGSDLVMAEKGKLVVDEFVYDSSKPTEGKAEYTLLDAAFSYVGGWMGKSQKADVSMNLNFGSLGIRGTRLLRAMKDNECWIFLEKGKVDVYNKGGSVTLKPGEGTIMRDKSVSPEVPHIWNDDEKRWIKHTVSSRDWKD